MIELLLNLLRQPWFVAVLAALVLGLGAWFAVRYWLMRSAASADTALVASPSRSVNGSA